MTIPISKEVIEDQEKLKQFGKAFKKLEKRRKKWESTNVSSRKD